MITLKIGDKLVTFDDEKYDLVFSYPWVVGKGRNTWYAVAFVNENMRMSVYMHRLVLDLLDDTKKWVDHIDGNGLNNCLDNLRICNPMQNGASQRKRENTTSQYKGVSWYAVGGTWQAHIYPNGKSIYLGRYATEEEAAIVYDEAARVHYDDFARLNFPKDDEHGINDE